MAGKPFDIPVIESISDSISPLHRIGHNAMATAFEVLIVHEDGLYARQAAQAAFDELDRLEGELSRYIDNSDISQISRLCAGESVKVGLDTFECLKQCSRIYDQTNGAFDITVGAFMDCWLDKNKNLRKPSEKQLSSARRRTGMKFLKLNEENFTVQVLADSVRVDLGGFGKGYAVDKIAELLRQWDIDTALIHSGHSSVLAVGAPAGSDGWALSLSNPDNRKEALAIVCLKNRAISGSGLQKGEHIIDPRVGRPVEGKCAAWVCAADAATADALSTAFMVMDPAEIERYCLSHPKTAAMIQSQEPAGHLLRYGQWDKITLKKS